MAKHITKKEMITKLEIKKRELLNKKIDLEEEIEKIEMLIADELVDLTMEKEALELQSNASLKKQMCWCEERTVYSVRGDFGNGYIYGVIKYNNGRYLVFKSIYCRDNEWDIGAKLTYKSVDGSQQPTRCNSGLKKYSILTN